MEPFRQLGPYELVERLAVGGMAEIYVARSKGVQGFEKDYVLKLIHPKYVGDAEFIRMLVDEAKLVGQLTHSNIAQVIDLGVDGESYYILMEYVRGKDLYQILQESWDRDMLLPIDMCVHIARDMCAGLYYAHTKNDENGRALNIVHRDISPQNVLVSFQGEVKILDFGVAKAALGARPETRAGIIKGKFRYMSPEQAWGEKLDGRSDLFGVGLCLYEMLTGQTAYEDDGDMQKMLRRMRDAEFTPPSRLRPDVDLELERIVMKSLARERHSRYPTCHAFAEDLAHYLHTQFPGFMPVKVMQVLKKLYPEETQDVHTPEPTAQTKAEIPSIGTDELEAMGFQEVDEPVDTDDLTLRQSVVRGPAADGVTLSDDGSFADELTELYVHPDESQDETETDQQLPTANLAGRDLRDLLVAEHDTVDLVGPAGQRTADSVEGGQVDRPRREPFVTPGPGDLNFRPSEHTTNDRTAPHRVTDRRRDTIAGLIEKHLPPSAADRALAFHQRLSDLLESDEGRKLLVPILGVTLGLFFLLVLVLIIF